MKSYYDTDSRDEIPKATVKKVRAWMKANAEAFKSCTMLAEYAAEEFDIRFEDDEGTEIPDWIFDMACDVMPED